MNSTNLNLPNPTYQNFYYTIHYSSTYLFFQENQW